MKTARLIIVLVISALSCGSSFAQTSSSSGSSQQSTSTTAAAQPSASATGAAQASITTKPAGATKAPAKSRIVSGKPRKSAKAKSGKSAAKSALTKPTPPAPAPPPWKQFYLNPAVRVRMDFRNASIDAVIQVLSKASGIPIVKDPALAGGITLETPKPQTLGNAFSMLSAILSLKNYEITKQTGFLMVAMKGAAPASGPPPGTPNGPGAPGAPGGPPPNRGGGPGGPGGPNGPEPVLTTYTLTYADATEVARVINDVFSGSNQPNNPFGGFQPPQMQQPGQNKPTVKASAEDYSNSVIVYAPPAQQTEIAGIIKGIDKSTSVPEVPQVFPLQFAKADDLQPIVQDILSQSSPLGRGGNTTSKQNQNQSRFVFFFGQDNGEQDQGGTVTADERSNSLVVTTTVENLKQITPVIEALDKPAHFETTTFVYTMKNARADVVANLLNEAFGNHTNGGPVGGSLTGNGLSQNLASQTQNNNNGNNGQNQNQPPSLGNNNQGGGQNGNQGASQQGTSFYGQNGEPETIGTDSEGHVVNVRSLMNQVLMVPNIDANSIIVVSPPEDKGVVENILEEMDEIPAQVMIETLVVEVSLDKTTQLGVEYKWLHNDLSQSFGLQSATNAAQGLTYALTHAQYSVFLNALQTDTHFNVLSTPRIYTTNNATSQINISQSLPYVTGQTVETTGATVSNYNFLNVGVVLTVTPRITEGGYVTMDVSQQANDFVSYSSFNAPITNQREAQTTVSVQDGQTVVLGGIIQDTVSKTVNKVPLLGDLPFIGNLFRSTNKSDNKTELLVMLTPHIVRDPEDAQRLRDQTVEELGKTATGMLPSVLRETLPPPAPDGRAPLETPPGGTQ